MEEQSQTLGTDEMFCPSCGAIVKKNAVICMYCGVRVPRSYFKGTRADGSGKAIAGGILGIVSGTPYFIGGIFMTYLGSTTDINQDSIEWAIVGIGIALLVMGILTIVGSTYAIARSKFPIAVLGGICALIILFPLGLPALILIATSGSAFERVKEKD